jgi:hypothetical protein
MHLNTLRNFMESLMMQINLGIDDLVSPPNPTRAMQEYYVLRLVVKGENKG